MTTTQDALASDARDLAEAPAFIETQFPVSKLSKESYKERRAADGQTLTALGKWWGRKPLVLVRAVILGLLLPSTEDSQADRDTFLALMTMDDDGLLQRIQGSIAAADIAKHCTESERKAYLDATGKRLKWAKHVTAEDRRDLQRLAFRRMSYDERLAHCARPEEVDGPSPQAWVRINQHLGTAAGSLPELVAELSLRRYGHTVRVADAFCGNGNIPFEAARIGCEAVGSDLNPVAGLLSWGSSYVVGGGAASLEQLRKAQDEVFSAASQQVQDWAIESDGEGWVADGYLYCNEVLDPATGWRVPLAPTWIVALRSTRAAARLIPKLDTKTFDIEIADPAGELELEQAQQSQTWKDGVVCPVDAKGSWMAPALRLVLGSGQLRGAGGLRLWSKDQIRPSDQDVFQERLYAVRWVNPASGARRWRSVTTFDMKRESVVEALLNARLDEWRSKGYLPTTKIESGSETNRLARERGWTYWHHLFNPRQLLTAGLIAELSDRLAPDEFSQRAMLLATGRIADWNSRLARWNYARDQSTQTFYNQALNPLVNYSCRPLRLLEPVVRANPPRTASAHFRVRVRDARQTNERADIWITDPGYADMVNYEELSEFFLAWYEKRLPQLFPDWSADSKRALAVAGKDQDFRTAMVECYRRFAEHTPENGFQVVMFTHQSAEVWADMALILWASGLRVSQAWTIATETGSAGIRQGNFVQGTVLLVLRKRTAEKRGDMADVYPDLQNEVQRQMQTMLDLDPRDDPNFSDSDYQLAAYAAALRVLTEYSSIDEIDVERELYKERAKGERSPLTAVIERAVRIASDFLVPDGLNRAVWRKLSAEERLYIKGVEIEAHGEYREGVYQEFARGFGVGEYRGMLGSSTANQTRLKTPSEFKGRDLGGQGFPGSLIRQLLFAIWTTASDPDVDPRPARTYLKQELSDYWDQRPMVLELLRYLADKPRTAVPSRIAGEDADGQAPMAHWTKDSEAARLLLGSIENDSI